MPRPPFVFILALLALCSCGPKDSAPPLFEKLSPRQTNVTFANMLEEEPLFNSVNYLYFYDGGGCAVGDLNNDGLADIYLAANMQPNQLYRNKGALEFEDITTKAGVAGAQGGWTTGVTMADVNADGWLDIYVCRSNYLDKKGANELFINNKDLTFSERAAEFGLAVTALSRQAAFFDYDRDGDLDMFLLTHSVHAKKTYGRAEKLRQVRDEEAGDKLFKNDNGHFVNVAAEAGINESLLGYGLGVAVGDLNSDGYPDIYVANDFHEDDYLYYNNGDGTFTEALRQSMQHTSSAAMGTDMADFNNDGWLDIVVLDMLPEQEAIRKSAVAADPFDIYDTKLTFGYYHQLRRNTLQLNRGGNGGYPLFSEIGQLAGIHATDWSWSPLFVDLDNDGRKDLFITNGIFRRPNDLDYLNYLKSPEAQALIGRNDPAAAPLPIAKEKLAEIVRHMPSVPLANYAFQNRGDLTFSNRAKEWGLDDAGFSSGAAYADFDNDGDMDLIVNNVNAPAAIYKNLLYQTEQDSLPANYLTVKFSGAARNAFGIGAKVMLHHREGVLYQELMPTRGFQSSVEPVLHFGLGNIAGLDSLEVMWPTGEYQVVKESAANQTITLRQSEASHLVIQKESFSVLDTPSLLGSLASAQKDSFKMTMERGEPLLQDVTKEIQLDYKHEENAFIDYNREPFIPHYLSTAGPACASAEVNGDGLEDLYLGGAKHQAGQIFLQKRSGGFEAVLDSAFIKDRLSEDVDAAFFDADGDARLDLYVVSGGNEFFGNAEPLRDRLYLNLGHGRFHKAEGMLPEIYANGACVQPSDIDRDGDLDLFVGSRSVPWQYGVIPQSYLLINDGRGRFVDEAATRAPGLAQVGMVTDAVWADLNKDSFAELIVVGEWMPITIFQNEDGRLIEATQKYGLQNTHGWWNTIAAADFNNDGFIDLVAGNLGLNSLLKASEAEPVQLFVHDFSGDQRPDQILTYTQEKKIYPLASVELLLGHMPALQQNYKKHADYAGKTVAEIFPAEQLKAATVRGAEEFASLLLMNNGNETLRAAPLPMAAQFAPISAFL
ncbi:MAG: VCBS repeat-containing protein, partial [candidate division KSB1 bacterium]